MFPSMNRNYTSLSACLIGAIFTYLVCVATPAAATLPADKHAAVIFVYQRIGEDSAAQGNISVDQFRQHLEELQKGGYHVLPLGKIIDAIKKGDALPAKTVGITFEGAYQATLANAAPLLEDAQMPFTVFFASDMIDSDNSARMTWDQIRQLRKNDLVSLGILPAAYDHLIGQTAEKNAEEINRAVARYREMLGGTPEFFAYPYGEFNAALKKQVAAYKFKAAFGQQSGVVYSGSDFNALPRFTMTDDYGDLDRFMLTAHALPLPVSDVVPDDAVLTQNPPVIGFTVTPELKKLAKLSCFASDTGKLPLTRIGNRVEIRPAAAFTDRRTRINCTLPNETFTPGEPPNWRWFGMLLTLPAVDEDATPTAADNTDGSDDGNESD